MPDAHEKKSSTSKEATQDDAQKPEEEKPRLDPVRKAKLLQMLERLHMQTGDHLPPEVMKALKAGTALEEVAKAHQFWSTQPVPQEDIPVNVVPGPFQEDISQDKVRSIPYPLPKEFEWVDIDVDNDIQLEGLYTLLNLNYNEDPDGMFRFDYSTSFLRWALKPPGFQKSWHFGVRATVSKKLVAFISAIPMQMRVLKDIKPMVEINFLCIHKKLRLKRLAPVLIKEVTRRSHLQGIFQAIYTAGTRIPTPVASCPYFHRTLNPKKLVEVGFTALPRGMSLARRIANDAVPATPPLKIRLMEEKDTPRVRELYNQFQNANTKLAPVYDFNENIKHWLLPIDDVLWTYVVDDSNGNVSDFVSFYRLDSSVLKHEVHKKINAAYLYYCGTTAQEQGEQALQARLQDLIQSALVMAKQLGFDVFNGIDCALNSAAFSKLKFAQGDGSLNYYLFNWQCPALERSDIGLIMV
ncbi:glycylpeptide N-tetradecanoyltransferase [Entomophthora muscae]|uniref:Glycylpeptide N-tetradecanoyltransferase n=1 Tax=Entomophthora muscae TaxID=34485 RepID=A0ACC2SNR2_9FUNG|nr:glycylpeptide N-tetradecanoyltransferase [Entomophthora muscae]